MTTREIVEELLKKNCHKKIIVQVLSATYEIDNLHEMENCILLIVKTNEKN